jgi:hypothetical protein
VHDVVCFGLVLTAGKLNKQGRDDAIAAVFAGTWSDPTPLNQILESGVSTLSFEKSLEQNIASNLWEDLSR